MNTNTQIYGLRAVLEAIKAGEAIDKVFIQRGLKGNLAQSLEQIVRKKGISSSYVPHEKLNKLSQGNHQGIVALISPVAFHELEPLVEAVLEKKKNPLFILLDQLSDVRNFGAIIRTAECSGADGIIIQKKGGAPVTADTIKTSAGAAFKVPIVKVDHLKDAVYYLQASGIKVIAATEKNAGTLYELSLEGPCALLLGAEDTGISASLLKIVDEQARIPLQGEIASLNVSVACGIFLFEVLRQRSLERPS